MSNEPNKPIPAQELSEEELAGIVGGGDSRGDGCMETPVIATQKQTNIGKTVLDPFTHIEKMVIDPFA